MNLPNILTVLRIALAPVFFILFWLPEWAGIHSVWVFGALCFVFLFIELSDVVDGWLARKYNLVTEVGKVLDPFSDVISRLTYFLSFLAIGILHPVFCLIILYREFGMVFFRMMMAIRGVAVAARSGGKLKSVFYFLAAAFALVLRGFQLYSTEAGITGVFQIVVHCLFGISALLALISFGQYLVAFFRDLKEFGRKSVDSTTR